MRSRDRNIIIGYCSYCKSPILEGEALVVSGGRLYHKFCYNQKNSYYFSLDEIEKEAKDEKED